MYRIIAVSAVCSFSFFAQTAVAPKDATNQKQFMVQMGDAAEFGPIGITAAMAGPMATVPGAPYSAQAVTRRVQVLADGNRIEQSTSGTVARDSQGRVRRDETLPGLGSGEGDTPHLVTIEDPVAGVHWMLDARTKTAIKMPFAHMKTGSGPFLPPPGPDKVFFFAGPAPAEAGGQVVIKKQLSPDSNVSKTELGTQTIEGVAAQGTRTTRTISAGSVGNEQPIVITTETWYSPDLKVLVMSKTEDPRMGETTYKLTNIQQSEPAANLFQVPDDYTVKDQPTNNFVYQEIKKNP
ncbi:MAG: hypothetical protein JO097_21075 [Acidobacteriaceae bacterium]|nr:hypothetical protein [Acidobacteriaceae bacterium]MBV9296825.1 hypothetical protein [Acidobacteriaceae bacterium]MBV9767177.1 hypothetical protein [Acidobacteriaceae bacterium]